MFKNILIALDGSEISLKAGLRAAGYSFCKGAKIHVITVFDPGSLTYGGILTLSREQTDSLRSSIRDKVLSPAIEAFKAANVEIEARMVEGPADDAILDEAKRLDCDLIVVGRRGMGKIQRWLAGSVSLSIARKSPCPVLIIPADEVKSPEKPIQKVLAPTDFSSTSRLGCKAAVDMSLDNNYQLFVCHSLVGWEVFPGGQPDLPFFDEALAILRTELRARLDNELDKIAPQKLKARAILTEGEADVGVLRAVEDTNIDLIVLSSHGRRGLNRWLIGSVAEKIVKSSPKPILLWKKLDELPVDSE